MEVCDDDLIWAIHVKLFAELDIRVKQQVLLFAGCELIPREMVSKCGVPDGGTLTLRVLEEEQLPKSFVASMRTCAIGPRAGPRAVCDIPVYMDRTYVDPLLNPDSDGLTLSALTLTDVPGLETLKELGEIAEYVDKDAALKGPILTAEDPASKAKRVWRKFKPTDSTLRIAPAPAATPFVRDPVRTDDQTRERGIMYWSTYKKNPDEVMRLPCAPAAAPFVRRPEQNQECYGRWWKTVLAKPTTGPYVREVDSESTAETEALSTAEAARLQVETDASSAA